MSNSDWWTKQLGTQSKPIQQRPVDIPLPPSQQPMTRFEPPVPQQPAVTKAQSAKQIQTCPECGSNNYMSVANAASRCYDCGYPLSQSGSKFGSLTGAKVEGSVKQSLGNDTQNNYNPQSIIGRIE